MSSPMAATTTTQEESNSDLEDCKLLSFLPVMPANPGAGDSTQFCDDIMMGIDENAVGDSCDIKLFVEESTTNQADVKDDDINISTDLDVRASGVFIELSEESRKVLTTTEDTNLESAGMSDINLMQDSTTIMDNFLAQRLDAQNENNANSQKEITDLDHEVEVPHTVDIGEAVAEQSCTSHVTTDCADDLNAEFDEQVATLVYNSSRVPPMQIKVDLDSNVQAADMRATNDAKDQIKCSLVADECEAQKNQTDRSSTHCLGEIGRQLSEDDEAFNEAFEEHASLVIVKEKSTQEQKTVSNDSPHKIVPVIKNSSEDMKLKSSDETETSRTRSAADLAVITPGTDQERSNKQVVDNTDVDREVRQLIKKYYGPQGNNIVPNYQEPVSQLSVAEETAESSSSEDDEEQWNDSTNIAETATACIDDAADITFEETMDHFQCADLDEYKSEIHTSVQRRGFALIRHTLFGPPKLKAKLLNERDLLFLVAQCPFKNSCAEHLRMLQMIYRQLRGGRGPPCPRYGQHWESIGFQGGDPSTDLRGLGMLGVASLVYLCTPGAQLTLAREIHALSQHPTQNFPYCVMGINLCRTALQLLREGSLNKEANTQGSVVTVFMEVFSALYLQLFTWWKTRALSITDSGHVMRELEAAARKDLKTMLRSFRRRLGRNVPDSTTSNKSKTRNVDKAQSEFVFKGIDEL